MRYSISDTAEFGDYETGKRLITDETKERNEESSGRNPGRNIRFKVDCGKQERQRHFNACRAKGAEHQLEQVGAEIRKFYSWNKEYND